MSEHDRIVEEHLQAFLRDLRRNGQRPQELVLKQLVGTGLSDTEAQTIVDRGLDSGVLMRLPTGDLYASPRRPPPAHGDTPKSRTTKNTIPLDSHHEDALERIVNHEQGTLDPGPPRRFVFSWHEDGWPWELTVREMGGTFSGSLLWDKADAGPVLVSDCVTSDEGWTLFVTWTEAGTDRRHVWTIKATTLPPDE
jgi:hypothetical protein